MAGVSDRDSARAPAWGGDPCLWGRCKDEVRICLLAQKKDGDFSMAGRLTQRLSGAARRAAMTLSVGLLLARRSSRQGRCQD